MKKQQKQAGIQAKLLFKSIDLPTHGTDTLRHIGVTMSAQVVRFTAQTIATIVLARLLAPADFGFIAMVAVLINFVATIKTAGLAHATVQRDDITQHQISCLFWINLAVSTSLAIIVVVSAPVIAWIYDEPRLTSLAIVLAIPVMLSGLGLQHRALLHRNMRFLDVARAEILAVIFGKVVGIYFAYKGFGYWSLAIMQIADTATSTVLLWEKTRWRPMWVLRGEGVRSMLRFGANLSGFNILNYFARNADNFLIGKFIGAEALGFYSRAYGLMLMPLQQLNAPLSKVLMPTLARFQHDPGAFSQQFLKYIKTIAWMTAVPTAVLSIFGQEVVTFLLGEDWKKAGEIFEWLAIAGMFQPLGNIMGIVLVALGKTDKMLRWGAISSFCIVSSFIIGLPFGSIGVAMMYAVSTNIVLILQPFYIARITDFICTNRYFAAIKLPALIAITFVIISRMKVIGI